MDVGRVASAILMFVAGIVEVMLAFRFVLKMFAASGSAEFTRWLYSSTDPLVGFFEGVFPSFSLGGVVEVELHTVLAIVVYAVSALILLQLIRAFEGVIVKPKGPSGPAIPQGQSGPQQPPQGGAPQNFPPAGQNPPQNAPQQMGQQQPPGPVQNSQQNQNQQGQVPPQHPGGQGPGPGS